MKKTLITYLSIAIFTLSINAQEFAPEEQGDALASNFVDATNDTATNIVVKTQQQPPVVQKNLPVDEDLNAVLQKLKINSGWLPERQMMVIKHVEEGDPLKTPPKYMRGFLAYRSIMYRKAILASKAKVIQAIGQKMSAKESMRVMLPAPEMGELNEAEANLKLMKADLEELSKNMGLQQQKVDAGPSIADKGNDLIEAIIKSIDSEYDPEKHSKEQLEELRIIDEQYQETAKVIAELETKTKVAKGKIVGKFKTSVQSLASMSLAGCTTLYTCEEYVKSSKSFKVGVITIWSVKLMEAARASLTGKKVEIKDNDRKTSIKDWAYNKLDLTKDFGPRTYVDNKGRRFFVGIDARLLTAGGGTFNNINREKAQIGAQQIAEFSRRADVQAQVASSEDMEAISTGNGTEVETRISETFDKLVSQGFEDREVEGAMELRSEEVIHPISGKKMFVSVSYISPDLAAAASSLKAENFQISKQEQVRNRQIRERDEAARNAPAKSILGERSGKPSSTGNTNSGSTNINGAVGNRPSESALDDF